MLIHLLLVAGLFVGRAQDQCLAVELAQLLDMPGQLVGRQFGQARGDDGAGDGLGAAGGAADLFEQVRQAAGQLYLQATIFQLVLQRLGGQWMGFQHDAAASSQLSGKVFGVGTGQRQTEADPELRTLARNTFQANFTAHQLDQLLGNGQAQAAAASLASQRVVGLAEGAEQLLLVLFGHPDTAVLHADAQLRTVVMQVFEHGANHDVTVLGELDGIADQVAEYLAQAQRVAEQVQRSVAVDQADQFQMLGMRVGGKYGETVLDQIAQVERAVIEDQPSGFDLRDVEDAVDDRQQVVGRLLDGIQVVALSCCQAALLQELGEAEHGVERSAYLMAHVGEEFGFDATGFQGFLARQVQFDVLDLDGFQILPNVLGGLLDAVVQLFLGVLQAFRHAVDAAGQCIQVMAAQMGQAGIQMALAKACYALLDMLQRLLDGAAQAQGQQGAAEQGGEAEQQGAEQMAIAKQQGVLLGQFQFQPAQQLLLTPCRSSAQVLIEDR